MRPAIRELLLGSPPLLLAGRTDVAAAYSLRRVSPGYSGALVRVRRSSDNAEMDIPGDSRGIAAIGTAQAWGKSSLFITKWYDQSGNGRDLAQATASAQPAFGVLSNGLPGMTFDGVDDYLRTAAFTLATSFSFNVVRRSVVTPAFYHMCFGGITSGKPWFANRGSQQQNLMVSGNLLASDNGVSMIDGQRGAVGGTFAPSGSTSILEVNATTLASFTATNLGSTGLDGLTFGSRGELDAGNFGNIEAQEFVLFNAGHSSAQIKADNAAMRGAWRF